MPEAPRPTEAAWLDALRSRARQLKAETYALYLAARHPATPWYAKLLAALVLAYAFSPIDLIPDFIPLLGYLDDLILVPAGIALTLRLIPAPVMEECRQAAQAATDQRRPRNWFAALVIVLIWLGLAAATIAWLRGLFL